MADDTFERFLYYPDRVPPDMPLPAWTPAGAEEVWMRASDGVRIHGLWWGEPAGAPAILFLHGNAQEVFSWSPVREDLAAAGCRMLLIDYRGYGKSEGEPSEAGLYLDGRAALDWLGALGVGGRQTVVFGKSLGGGVACEIARDRDLMGLVLESTFTSLASVASNLFPFAPGYSPGQSVYASIDRMASINCPVLVIHGDGDMLIPVSEGLALYEAAREPRELYIVEGAGHNDVSIVAGEQYGRRIRAWLDRAAAGQDQSPLS
jgi:fermentation-respiration switch protein FrsA (DUF1100 family)